MTDTVHITDTRVSSYSDKLGNPTFCGKATKGRTKIQRNTTIDRKHRATCEKCLTKVEALDCLETFDALR